MKLSWTFDQLETAKGILSEYPIDKYNSAVLAIQEALGRHITQDSIYNAFKRQGLGSPSSYCQEVSARNFHLIEPDDVDDRSDTLPRGMPAVTQADIDAFVPKAAPKGHPVKKLVDPDRYWIDKEPERVKIDPGPLQCWLVWSDVHVPFECKQSFETVLSVAEWLKPYGTAVIGDFADMMTVSSHPKIPLQYRWQLKDEVDAVNARLDQIDALGCQEKKFFAGNHDARGQRLAMQQMIGIYDTLDPKNLFRLEERNWQYYPYRQHSRIGKVWLVHDIGFSGKYAAYQNGDAFQASTLQGHTHAASVTYFGSVLGERHVSCTIGWLGDDSAADYIAPIKSTRNWQKAFALMWIETNTQNTHVQVIPIIDGRCVVNGKVFGA